MACYNILGSVNAAKVIVNIISLVHVQNHWYILQGNFKIQTKYFCLLDFFAH